MSYKVRYLGFSKIVFVLVRCQLAFMAILVVSMSSGASASSPQQTFVNDSNAITQPTAARPNEKEKNFFEQRYRGWLWFDEREKTEVEYPDKEQVKQPMPTLEEMKQAKQENERFTEELELLRHIMIRYPENVDYVVMYKRKEKEMQDKAEILGKNWAIANFLNPDIIDTLENPQNMYGRKIYKDEQQKADLNKIKIVAKAVDLFVFRKDGCPYCVDLENHLSTFATRYGFKVEAVSPDNSVSKYFKTNKGPELIHALKLDVMPTVIVVVKETRERFELSRGAVSVSDLEDSALILSKILEDRKKDGK